MSDRVEIRAGRLDKRKAGIGTDNIEGKRPRLMKQEDLSQHRSEIAQRAAKGVKSSRQAPRGFSRHVLAEYSAR